MSDHTQNGYDQGPKGVQSRANIGTISGQNGFNQRPNWVRSTGKPEKNLNKSIKNISWSQKIQLSDLAVFFVVKWCISSGQLNGAGRPNHVQHYVKTGAQTMTVLHIVCPKCTQTQNISGSHALGSSPD